MITGDQLKAARSVSGFSVQQLSDVTGLATMTIKRYESSRGVPKSRKGHLELLKTFFESRGIEFVGAPDEGPGIRIWGRDSG